jgi:hypothetical protein
LRRTRHLSRLDFSDEDNDIIDQIIITLALVFEKVIENISAELQSPKSIKRKPKVGKPRRVEPYIVSKLTRSVEDYKRILSNPRTLDLINNKLLKHKLLGKMYSTIIREAFSAFEKGDESFYNALNGRLLTYYSCRFQLFLLLI